VSTANNARGSLRTQLGWYINRLGKMSPAELGWRIRDQATKWGWARDQVKPGATPPARRTMPFPRRAQPGPALMEPQRFRALLPEGAVERVPPEARRSTIIAADDLLAGRWEILGFTRTDMEAPDWFLDPVTGRRAPATEYCFKVDFRDEALTGNIKQVWELSRMHHVTVLAAAYAFTGDDRYAQRVASHLRSWWAQNPFLSGAHWTSGIESGLRLISWTWARRLLEGWSGAIELFEHNPVAIYQIWWHQRYLAHFRSRGSSANNHVIAEAAGQLVAALAFNWFEESEAWASQAVELLEAELGNNTFPSGINREMACDYHGFVAELALVGAAEADLAGRPLGEETWAVIARMLDVGAATIDEKLRAPRYGDGDDGRALVLDPGVNRWQSLLSLGAAVVGEMDWWPKVNPDATSTLLAAICSEHHFEPRPNGRSSDFRDAGLTIMRTAPSEGAEIWCRCDAGPHGFLSIAAHAHADALAVEVRHGGVDILADPGTYCYHGDKQWRNYFRSTLGHNTLELDRQDQSTPGGPFLWARHARSRVVELVLDDDGEAVLWTAEHAGYQTLRSPATHRRTVHLERHKRLIEIKDIISSAGDHPYRLPFHLGPDVDATISGPLVELQWRAEDGRREGATLRLPAGATCRLARGDTDPVLGWYSPRFGEKVPATTVLCEGISYGHTELVSILDFSVRPPRVSDEGSRPLTSVMSQSPGS
jgi:hypothetical protein